MTSGAREWRLLRAELIGHAVLGSGLAIYLFYLLGRPAPLAGAAPWVGWGLLVALWLAALVPLRQRVQRHRGNPSLPVPRWGKAVLIGALLFEAGTLLPLMDAWYCIDWLNFWLLVLHLGMLLATVLGGLSFLALRVPFRRRIFGVLTVLLGVGFGLHWTISTDAWAGV